MLFWNLLFGIWNFNNGLRSYPLNLIRLVPAKGRCIQEFIPASLVIY